MKIGILTFHNIPNFGAILQAYSLCKGIRKLGYDCEIIDYECENIVKRELSFKPTGNFLKNFVLKELVWKKNLKKIALCNDFMKRQNIVGYDRYTKENLSDLNFKYDTFISGSDMIWNSEITDNDLSFFLDFVREGKTKIAYGSSVGAEIKNDNIENIKKYLATYDSIAVRESDTETFLREKISINAETVCDPTMLLSREEWEAFAHPVKEKNYVLVYFPYKEILLAAKRYAKKHGKKLIVINNSLPLWGVNNKPLYSIEDWISYIQHADVVFTDSYHGLLFSLYFNKPVWTNNNGIRFTSLLKKMGLEKCFIENDTDFSNVIDYNVVENRIGEFREESIAYLRTSLARKLYKTSKAVSKKSSNCSGCTACESVCPKTAIKLLSDSKGFLIPSVNNALCVDCGLCVSVCPIDTEGGADATKHSAFAVFYKNDTVRKISASGAFFQGVAKYFIESGGYVCGCVLDNLVATHIVTNKIDDVLRMADSKYVQSDMKNCFTEIVLLLKQGKKVLFSGTSCQVDGLKRCLSKLKVQRKNLVTIDFFCHGVPSPKVFADYLSFYEKENHTDIYDFRFRSKKYGWGKIRARGANYLNSVNSDNLHKSKFSEKKFSVFSKLWTNIFFSNLTLRENCFSCPYTKIEKPADFTMGDFWGVEESSAKDFDDGKGLSVVIAHNDAAEWLLSSISDLAIKQVPIEEARAKQWNSFKPCKQPSCYEAFWEDYIAQDFKSIAKKYFNYTLKVRLKFIIRRILFDLRLRRI